jgi:hypothetical protein
MKEIDIETILQRGMEKFPYESTRVISDNGPQFISSDFWEYIRISRMTHVRTSPYYPQLSQHMKVSLINLPSSEMATGSPHIFLGSYF